MTKFAPKHALVLAALPMLAAVCTGPALAQTVEGSGSSKVLMFDRPPSVDELRDAVSPEPKIRTRSIEILGGAANTAAKRPRATDEVNYGTSPPPAPPRAQQQQQQPAPQPASQMVPQAPQAVPQMAPQQAALPTAASAPEPDAAPQAFGFRINFAFNSADIPSDSTAYIDAVGGLMKEDPNLALTVEGHTDATGTLAYNMTLSQRRAISVGEYLVRVHHIDPQRITVAGKGPSDPIAASPYDGRNRRVEFKPTH